LGIPGIGDEIERAIQHAPQPTRQSISESPETGTAFYPLTTPMSIPIIYEIASMGSDHVAFLQILALK
jgi:hypothetical protein